MIPSAKQTQPQEFIQLLLIPSLVFFSLMFIFEHFQLDLYFADGLYQLEGATSGWPLRDAWFTRHIMHDSIHDIVVTFAILLLFTIIASFKINRLKPARTGLIYLLLTMLITTIIVGILKKVTHVNCPWDLIRYGGLQPYVDTFSALPTNVKPGQCFPGGHATSGYGWIGIFFICRLYWPQWQYWALSAILLFGFSLDIDQQTRGAHFASHGLWTLAISWWVSCLAYLLFLKTKVTISNK